MLHIWRVYQLAHGTTYFHGESRQLLDTGMIGAKEIMWTDVAHLKYVACSICVYMPRFAKFLAACPLRKKEEQV